MPSASEQQPPEKRPQWDRWTLDRGALAAAWIVAACLLAVYPFFVAGLLDATLFGEDPGPGELRLSAAFTLIGWAIVGAGPIMVWRWRRRLVWLLAGLLCFAWGWYSAIELLVESFTVYTP